MQDATTHQRFILSLTGGGGAPPKEVSGFSEDPIGSANNMNDKGENKARLNKQRQDFLLTFFSEKDGNVHKEVNGFILEKMWNGNKKCWQVAIYPKESWSRRQEYSENNLDWIK